MLMPYSALLQSQVFTLNRLFLQFWFFFLLFRNLKILGAIPHGDAVFFSLPHPRTTRKRFSQSQQGKYHEEPMRTQSRNMQTMQQILVVNLIGSKSSASFLDQSHNKTKIKQSRITFDTQLKIALCKKQIVSFLRSCQF